MESAYDILENQNVWNEWPTNEGKQKYRPVGKSR